MNFTGTQELLFAVVGALIIVVAVIYAIMRGRRRSAASRLVTDAATRRNYASEDRKKKAETAPPVIPSGPAGAEPHLTEDEMQQAALGGVKGDPKLPGAPLTAKERANTFG